jgi:pimeloyl-ACP methyl ester carboxylesterase
MPGLGDHVDEVIAEVDRCETEVVLVGHSYAGLVVRQAADRRSERVRRIVLIDGWAGRDGASLLMLAPAVEEMIKLAHAQPGFLGLDSIRDADGFGFSASYWRD